MEIINRIAKSTVLLLILKSYYRLPAEEPSGRRGVWPNAISYSTTVQNLHFRLSLSEGLDLWQGGGPRMLFDVQSFH